MFHICFLFQSFYFFTLMTVAAGRMKFDQGPHLARGPHFGHPWLKVTYSLTRPRFFVAFCPSKKVRCRVKAFCWSFQGFIVFSVQFLPPEAQLIHTLSKFHCLIHELYPTNHHSSQEHATYGTSCLLLAFLNLTTCHLSNQMSINLI